MVQGLVVDELKNVRVETGLKWVEMKRGRWEEIKPFSEWFCFFGLFLMPVNAVALFTMRRTWMTIPAVVWTVPSEIRIILGGQKEGVYLWVAGRTPKFKLLNGSNRCQF